MALTAARDTKESAILLDGILSFPMAAATTIFAGDVVCTDASGNAVALTASTALKAWGRAERTVINTTAAGFGTAGALRIDAKRGVYGLPNGAGADVINASHVGHLAYGGPFATANLTDGGGLRPALGKIYGLLGSEVLVGIGESALYDLADDITGGNQLALETARVRNVVNGNVDLAAYVVASDATLNDATAGVAGNVVMLVAQTTPAQNGLYVIGTVAAGVAPLTRIAPMPTGYVFLAGEFEIAVASGTVFGNTKWFNTAGGAIGTNDPALYPEKVTISQALVAGTFTITSIPVLSVTKSFIGLTRRIANTPTATTGGYCTTNAGSNGVTAGALGTASVIVQACVAAGTINNADISTLEFSVHNR